MTLAVTLTDPYDFADDNHYSVSVAITGLTAYTYFVAYYGTGASATGPLTAFVVKAVSTAGIYSLTTAGPSSYLGTGGGLYEVIRATTLDSGDVVVAYPDSNSNNGITCVLVKYDADTGGILFGSVLQLTTGTTTMYLTNSGAMNIQLVTIGNGFQFMAMFNDLEIGGGALVAVIGEVSTCDFHGQYRRKLNLFSRSTIHSTRFNPFQLDYRV